VLVLVAGGESVPLSFFIIPTSVHVLSPAYLRCQPSVIKPLIPVSIETSTPAFIVIVFCNSG